MKVALVHDWLNGMRGGEYVLEAIAELYPDAVIYTLFCEPDRISDKLKSHKIVTSFIQNIPLRKKYYRHYLPLFPSAIESFNFANFDIVISCSHCVAKGAVTGPNTLHICYCLQPMRYVWDRFDDYFPKDKINPARYRFISFMAKRLRAWDKRSSDRVDLFISDSNFVNRRINSFYKRRSEVIFPPVNTDFFTPGSSARNDYFLLAGAMVPYKRGDIVIEAFRGFDKKLVVTGSGPDLNRLKSRATDNIEFAGWVDNNALRDYYRGCSALIFPGIEDFGIIPVEAQACGKPVIAFGEGGLLDTVIGPVIDDYKNHKGFKSGIFFTEQTPQSIRAALDLFTAIEFDSDSIVRHAQEFSERKFSESISKFVSAAYENFKNNGKTGLEERLLK